MSQAAHPAASGAGRISEVAAALASPARAEMVCLLLGGTAHTGRELARHAGIAPSTASEHLGRLLDAGVVAVEVQGRHRYFRLAGREVAALVEALLVVAPRPMPLPTLPTGLAFARSCYDHLAGRLGVALHDRLVELDAVHPDAGAVTGSGRELLAGLGVPAGAERSRPLVRPCLDWSQRRHHLAGTVAARLLQNLLDRRWLVRHATRPRELRLTRTGRDGLRTHLEIEVS